MINKVIGTIKKFKLNNPAHRRASSKKRDVYLTKEFLSSDKFSTLFENESNLKNDDFINYTSDAEDETKNYYYRHHDLGLALGSWRWKGVYTFRDAIIPILFDDKLRGVDFGGAYGPIAKHTDIVDFNPKDVFGREVNYKGLDNLDFKPDFIFSSHTLEHIPDLKSIFSQFKEVLKPDGTIFLNLPAYSCTRWRNGSHVNRKFNDHAWTFCLSENEVEVKANKYPNTLVIDSLLSEYFDIIEMSYTGDNSIFIIAKHKK